MTVDPPYKDICGSCGVYVCICHGVSSLTFYVESNSIISHMIMNKEYD